MYLEECTFSMPPHVPVYMLTKRRIFPAKSPGNKKQVHLAGQVDPVTHNYMSHRRPGDLTPGNKGSVQHFSTEFI